MPRIHLYVPEAPSPGTYLLPEAQSHHLLRVLRARRGQALTLFCGDGWDYPAQLEGTEGKIARLQQDAPQQRDTASPLALTLALPLMRSDRWDWALQKATELGVTTIQPVHTRHCQGSLAEALQARRQQRWQDIVIAAAEQSQATRLPELLPAQALSDALSLSGLTGLVFDGDAPVGLEHALSHLGLAGDPAAHQVTLLTGPEGGLHPEEVALASERGLTPCRLGPRILRAETAAITAVGLLQARWGDLGL